MQQRKTCTESARPAVARIRTPVWMRGHRRKRSARNAVYLLTAKKLTIPHRMLQRRKLCLRTPGYPLHVSQTPWRYWDSHIDTEWTLDNIRLFWEESCLYRGWFSAPEVPEVSQDALGAFDPGFKGVPPSKLRDAITSEDDSHSVVRWRSEDNIRVWPALRSYTAKPVKCVLPKTWEVVLDDFQVSTGITHYVAWTTAALLSPGPLSNRRRPGVISMVPLDILVLVAYCAKLPPIPPSNPEVTYLYKAAVVMGSKGDTGYIGVNMLRLPTLLLHVPDTDVLPYMLQFFGTRDAWQFFCHLLQYIPARRIPGFPEDLNEQACDEWATRVATHRQPWQIAGSMRACRGVWMDAVSLQVSDKVLWTTLKKMWDVLWGAREKQLAGTVQMEMHPVPPRTSTLIRKIRIFSVPYPQAQPR